MAELTDDELKRLKEICPDSGFIVMARRILALDEKAREYDEIKHCADAPAWGDYPRTGNECYICHEHDGLGRKKRRTVDKEADNGE